MARKGARPRQPAGLGKSGKALWRSIIGDLPADWQLDAREIDHLTRACRCADELAELEAAVDRDGPTVAGSRGQTAIHPALSEARQLRLVQLRLLSALEMSDPAKDGARATPAQARARKAAEARYGGKSHG